MIFLPGFPCLPFEAVPGSVTIYSTLTQRCWKIHRYCIHWSWSLLFRRFRSTSSIGAAMYDFGENVFSSLLNKWSRWCYGFIKNIVKLFRWLFQKNSNYRIFIRKIYDSIFWPNCLPLAWMYEVAVLNRYACRQSSNYTNYTTLNKTRWNLITYLQRIVM